MTASASPVRRALIVPVYRNEATLLPLLDIVEYLHERVGGLELVVVVDGSPDNSYEVLRRELPSRPFPSQLLRHARNFGSIAAVRSGLLAADREQFAVMAADLQEPPQLIVEFFAALDEQDVDVVVGERSSREDPRSSRQAANTFWWAYRRFVQPDMPSGGIDVFAGTRQVRDALVAMSEANSSMVGQLIWLGYRRVSVPYGRLPRGDEGKSGWTVRKKVAYMLDSMYGFSALPIHLVTTIGVVGVVACVLVALLILLGRLVGAVDVRGYTPLMITMLLCTSLLLAALGMVGNYVWRTFENSKGRPLAVIDRAERFGSQPRDGVDG
jgi:hypothetical protein